MNLPYTNKDYLLLALMIEKHDNTIEADPWCMHMSRWLKRFETKPDTLINVIIDCFFVIYGPLKADESKVKEIICNTPLYLLSIYASDISIEDPIGFFANWRLNINK